MNKKITFTSAIFLVCLLCLGLQLRTVETDGLIALFHINENTGTTTIDSKNGISAALTGGIAWVTGVYGACLQGDGTDGEFRSEDARLNLSGTKFSMGGWFNSSIAFEDGRGIIGNVNNIQYMIQQGANNKCETNLYLEGDLSNWLTHNTSIEANKWYFFVFTYDGSFRRFYVNGELDDSDAETRSINAAAGVWFLNYSTEGSKYFNGKFDEVFVKEIALSHGEIRQAYLGGKGRHIN